MALYAINYRQTEFRTAYIDATDSTDAYTKWLRGDLLADEFVTTDDGALVVSIDEEQDGKDWPNATTWLTVWSADDTGTLDRIEVTR